MLDVTPHRTPSQYLKFAQCRSCELHTAEEWAETPRLRSDGALAFNAVDYHTYDFLYIEPGTTCTPRTFTLGQLLEVVKAGDTWRVRLRVIKRQSRTAMSDGNFYDDVSSFSLIQQSHTSNKSMHGSFQRMLIASNEEVVYDADTVRGKFYAIDLDEDSDDVRREEWVQRSDHFYFVGRKKRRRCTTCHQARAQEISNMESIRPDKLQALDIFSGAGGKR